VAPEPPTLPSGGSITWMRRQPDRPTFVVWLLISAGVNVLALIVVDWMFDGVAVGRWGSIILAAVVLSLGNAFLKPLLALLTLPLVILTFGLAYFAINVLMLALAEWIAPDFSIDGFWTYVGATIVIWLVNVLMQALLGKISGNRP
jgi:putative membrane protein